MRPRELRTYVSYWLDRFVFPKLVYPKTRRGPKSDHLAWLADLAVYRSDLCGDKRSKKFVHLTGKLPLSRAGDARFSQSRLSKAKADTLMRLEDLREKGFWYSIYGKLG